MRVGMTLLAVTILLFVGDAPSRTADPKPPAAIQVPYRLSATKHILVRAKINGRGPFNLVLDTGAPVVVFARKIAESLNITPDAGNWADLKRLEFEGGVVLENTVARFDDLYQLEGMNGLGLAGIEIHGLVGYPVLARFRIEYDFTKPNLSWTPVAVKLDELPRKSGRNMSTGGLSALGAMMKGLGKFIGADQVASPKPRGLAGMSVAADGATLRVSDVLAGGPAERAGIKVHDVILKVNNRKIENADSFGKAINSLTSGQTVSMLVLREGVEHEITIAVGEGF
jgi:PDZ domain/Aspartyl protease